MQAIMLLIPLHVIDLLEEMSIILRDGLEDKTQSFSLCSTLIVILNCGFVVHCCITFKYIFIICHTS